MDTRWGTTFLRRVGRGEDHASAALAADDAEARRARKAPPQRGSAPAVTIEITVGDEAPQTVAEIDSVDEAIEMLERDTRRPCSSRPPAATGDR